MSYRFFVLSSVCLLLISCTADQNQGQLSSTQTKLAPETWRLWYDNAANQQWRIGETHVILQKTGKQMVIFTSATPSTTATADLQDVFIKYTCRNNYSKKEVFSLAAIEVDLSNQVNDWGPPSDLLRQLLILITQHQSQLTGQAAESASLIKYLEL